MLYNVDNSLIKLVYRTAIIELLYTRIRYTILLDFTRINISFFLGPTI